MLFVKYDRRDLYLIIGYRKQSMKNIIENSYFNIIIRIMIFIR